MDRFVADFHIHSRYSYDSLMRPEKILSRAKKQGLDAVAITDHGTIMGAKEGKKYEDKFGVRVISGSEVKSDAGDIIGLNINEEITSTAWREVVNEIRSMGGVVVLPHPYRSHQFVQDLAEAVDLIEIWNARSTPYQNAQAAELASELGKGGLLGSDAHLIREIGNVRAVYETDSWILKETLRARSASELDICASQVIRHLRRGEYFSLIQEGGRWLSGKIL